MSPLDLEVELGNVNASDEMKVASGLSMIDVELNDLKADMMDAAAAEDGKKEEEKGLGWVLAGLILFSFTAPSALVGVPVSD